jgi:hypothetical protein
VPFVLALVPHQMNRTYQLDQRTASKPTACGACMPCQPSSMAVDAQLHAAACRMDGRMPATRPRSTGSRAASAPLEATQSALNCTVAALLHVSPSQRQPCVRVTAPPAVYRRRQQPWPHRGVHCCIPCSEARQGCHAGVRCTGVVGEDRRRHAPACHQPRSRLCEFVCVCVCQHWCPGVPAKQPQGPHPCMCPSVGAIRD